MRAFPQLRVQEFHDAPVNPTGDFVLYWMIANRRATWNFSLERAVQWAAQLQKPLIILEALRCDYPWASERFHRFVIEGMTANEKILAGKPVFYYPYVEPTGGAGKGLLAALAKRACVVVTDDFPCFMLPAMTAAAASQITVKFEKVDSNGLLPMRAAADVFPTAYAFRRFLQKNLALHLAQFPLRDPFADADIPSGAKIPDEILRRWPRAAFSAVLPGCPVDPTVRAVVQTPGGAAAAQKVLQRFLSERLMDYREKRNEPEAEGSSGFSPYLHFGHLSAHEVFAAVAEKEGWSADKLSSKTKGSREGWWGMTPAAESFLDELITWREVGFNMCSKRDDYDRFESLPDWALRTLSKHEKDARPHVYDLNEFERATTHDPLWNAAQNQLRCEGRIHNYLRMLWGKKILEWAESPRQALEILIELNNKYALDGRNPNSYSGIFWCLGRYDRAWGPERPIFGTVRYMSSENTARKMSVKSYIKRFAASAGAEKRPE